MPELIRPDGPAVNIKRSPLCGRNFEYFSEDPYLAGEMSAAFINGVQSRNVGPSIKHFAANSQEHRRMSSSSNVDERTLREIYFPAFENLRISANEISDTDTLTATVTVKNTGSRPGKTVVQLYTGRTQPGNVIRPVRELKGFDKVFLNPAEEKNVTFTLDKRSFAYWNEKIGDWHVETGWYSVEIGHSSRDIALCDSVYIESAVRLPRNYTADTILMDLMADPEAITAEMNNAMMNYMPLRGVLSFGGGAIGAEVIEAILEKLNSI